MAAGQTGKFRYILHVYEQHTKVFARPLALRESGRHARSYVIEYRNILGTRSSQLLPSFIVEGLSSIKSSKKLQNITQKIKSIELLPPHPLFVVQNT